MSREEIENVVFQSRSSGRECEFVLTISRLETTARPDPSGCYKKWITTVLYLKSIFVVVADAMMAWLTFQLLPSVVVKLWLCGHSCPVAFQLLPSGLQLDAPA